MPLQFIRIQTGERIIEDVFREIKPTIGVGARVGGTILAVLWHSDAIKGGDLRSDQYPDYSPFVGNGNRRDNSNPHIVYQMFYTPNAGKSPVLKYGISDELRWGTDRPEVQKRILEMKYKGRGVNWKIMVRTNNRDKALEIEEGLVDHHITVWNERPIEQIRP